MTTSCDDLNQCQIFLHVEFSDASNSNSPGSTRRLDREIYETGRGSGIVWERIIPATTRKSIQRAFVLVAFKDRSPTMQEQIWKTGRNEETESAHAVGHFQYSPQLEALLRFSSTGDV
jgi:hypothetical protein